MGLDQNREFGFELLDGAVVGIAIVQTDRRADAVLTAFRAPATTGGADKCDKK